MNLRASRWLAAVGLLVAIMTSACTQGVESSSSAEKTIVARGLLQIEPAEPGDTKTLFRFGVLHGLINQTEIVQAKGQCQGAAGSVLPPLTLIDCFPAVAQTPFDFLQSAVNTVTGHKEELSYVHLTNAHRFWVHQEYPTFCWATTLQMARAIHGLPSLSQDNIVSYGAQMCPDISNQQFKTDAYQLLYIIKKVYLSYDQGHVNPDICTDAKCIVRSLQGGKPIIMLKHGHAVLIVGADFEIFPQYPDSPVLKYLHLLDPATDPHDPEKEKIIPFLDACKTDVLIAY